MDQCPAWVSCNWLESGEFIVGKVGLAGLSLTAAIPGALLCFLMVQAALSSISEMPPVLMVAVLLALVISLMMALMPLYALLWYRPAGYVPAARKEKPVKEKAGKAAAAAAAAPVVEELAAEEIADDEELIDDVFEEHGEELAAPSDVDFDDDDLGDAGTEFNEEFEFDEFEDDEKK